MLITAIIPTLNEGERIEGLLAQLLRMDPGMELIVVDGGSRDGTPERAATSAKVIAAPRGRGEQMNAGATAATGDTLWFLHADSVPDADSIRLIHETLLLPDVAAGAFSYRFDGDERFFRLLEAVANPWNRKFGNCYGDMGIFMRRDRFEAMGGFAPMPLMEDMEFCRRLRRLGRVVVLPQTIATSVRRWRAGGLTRTTLLMASLQLAWLFGASPGALARHYRFGNSVPPARNGADVDVAD